jgi:hypothetical protein
MTWFAGIRTLRLKVAVAGVVGAQRALHMRQPPCNRPVTALYMTCCCRRGSRGAPGPAGTAAGAADPLANAGARAWHRGIFW